MPALKSLVREQVLLKTGGMPALSDEQVVSVISEEVNLFARKSYIGINERSELTRDVFNSIRRFDILQDLLDNPDITEIMVNGPNDIFIEKDGALFRHGKCFDTQERVDDLAQQLASACSRSVNEAHPVMDGVLPSGARINIVVKPVARNGPVITIRKFSKDIMTMEKLEQLGSLSHEAVLFLKRTVAAGYNVFVSGGTGSGKTTFLNALSGCIPKSERVITIEDSAELQLKGQENLVSLEVRSANAEGKNSVTMRDLIKTSLRMRPNRIVVGEVRDEACVDMLQALNTGHSGMSTGHANSVKDLLSRLETLVLLGTDIPLPAVRRQIASAIEIVVHLGRLRDKSRRVLEITEITGYENGEITLNPVFLFEESSNSTAETVEGGLKRTGSRLLRISKMKAAGFFEECAEEAQR